MHGISHEEVKMTFKSPEEVRSPKVSWTLIELLFDGGEEQNSHAIGERQGKRVLALR